jgi:hypothetical protein
VAAAEKATDRDSISAAVGQLNALKNEVLAQRGKKISLEAADLVLDFVDNVIARLAG